MPNKTKSKKSSSARAKATVASPPARTEAMEAVAIACATMTHYVQVDAIDILPKNLVDLTFREVGITDTDTFKDVLKEILDLRADEINKLELSPSQQISSVVEALSAKS